MHIMKSYTLGKYCVYVVYGVYYCVPQVYPSCDLAWEDMWGVIIIVHMIIITIMTDIVGSRTTATMDWSTYYGSRICWPWCNNCNMIRSSQYSDNLQFRKSWYYIYHFMINISYEMFITKRQKGTPRVSYKKLFV